VNDSTASGHKEVILKPRKARPFFGRHPWVLESAVARVVGEPSDGEEVVLVSDRGERIARGFYNSHSQIRVRLFTWSLEESLDEDFFRRRMMSALALRKQLGYCEPEQAARLVASEADGLGGLTVDRYADQLVLSVTSKAMVDRLEMITRLLAELASPRGMWLRTDKAMARREGFTVEEGRLWGEQAEGPVFIDEHGLRYGVELASGQKTGFYLDQRENRRAAAAYMRGRRVLDMCCYTGGFALAAVRLGDAHDAVAFDSSQKAIALARANAELNEITNVRFEVGDAFQTLKSLASDGERFGVVILDPPKFARARDAVPAALRAYENLNRMAVDVLAPDGVLVTCSCSAHVGREDFLFVLADVAQQTGRNIQVLEQRGAAQDHPVLATCLESEYLKCMICRVE
jgi:23S rRNA (cytosine1962-C5)-methyltransferase